jgi:prenyltransferase beta subunit
MGISVKVSTKKVIAAMEQKIASNTKKIAEHAKACEKFEAAQEKHRKFVQDNAAKIAKSVGVTPEVSVDAARYWGSNAGKISVGLTYYLNKEDAESLAATPVFEFEHGEFGSVEQMGQENRELGNAIRLLNMTDEEYVNTNTYKHVAKYL